MTELTIPQVFTAVARDHPDRACILQGEQRLTYFEIDEASDRLAKLLGKHGLGCSKEREALHPWQSGHDHVGLLMYNSPEYLIAELAAAKARAAAINMNFRYQEEELLYLIKDAGLCAIIFDSALADKVTGIKNRLDERTLLVQVPDSSGKALVDGAIWWANALEQGAGGFPLPETQPDDLHILYTGGTTGMPKGVLWRQADIIMAGLGGRRASGHENSLDDFLRAASRSASKMMPAGPFMHASGRWTALSQILIGNIVVLPENAHHFDPAGILETMERERVAGLNITGDAMARPLLAQLDKRDYALDDLRVIVSGAAGLSEKSKQAFLSKLPHIEIVDSMGSSETGPQASSATKKGAVSSRGAFRPAPGTTILSEDRRRMLDSSETGIGWLARSGRIPLGYLGDRAKTEKAFQALDGITYAVPGDRARWLTSGFIELVGRDAMTINSGGEKIFAEEVENAIRRCGAVEDTLVCGRPSQRWGQEVVAIISLREGHAVSDDEILAECGKHLARYKLPKAIIRQMAIARSPSGKPDYAWAKSVAQGEGRPSVEHSAGAEPLKRPGRGGRNV